MLIEFSELNIKLLILLIFPVFNFIENYSKKAYINKENFLFKIFRYFLSYVFAGIFLVIIKIMNRKPNSEKILTLNTEEKVKSVIDGILKKDKRKEIILNCLFLILLCGIGIFCQYYRKLFEKSEYLFAKLSIEIFFYITCFAVLSYFILNQKLYRHNFVTLVIIALVVLILFIKSFPYLEKIFESFLYYLFYSLLFSFYDVLIKKYMNVYYSTPYFVMFIIGSVNATILLVFDVIAFNVKSDISGIIIGFHDNVNSTGDVFMFILDIILECVWNLGFMLTIFYFTPSHTFISEFISQFSFYILSAVEGNNKDFYSKDNVIIFSIGYFINFCCIIIFNEVIILNFFGLDYNTRKRIQQRERKDSDFNIGIDLNSISEDENESFNS